MAQTKRGPPFRRGVDRGHALLYRLNKILNPVPPRQPTQGDFSYKHPKQWRLKRLCRDCNRAISDASGQMCRECYRKKTIARYAIKKTLWDAKIEWRNIAFNDTAAKRAKARQ